MVIRIKPRREDWARENIENQGAECYVPRAEVRSARTRRLRVELLFPGYGFVRHPEGRWAFLRGTRGVLDVVMSGGGDRPAAVPDSEIARLRAREGGDGLVRLEAREFELGERVRVDRGAVSLDAVVDGMSARDRIWVLVEWMGGLNRTEVKVEDVSRG